MALAQSFNDYIKHKEIVGLFSVLLVLGLLFTFLPGSFLSGGSAFLRISEIGVSFEWPVFGITLAFSGLVLLATSFLLSLLMVSVNSVRSSIPEADLNDHVFAAAQKIFLFFILLFGASVGLSLLFESLSIPLYFAQLVLFVVYLPFMFALPSFAIDDYSFAESLLESTRFLRVYPNYVMYYSVVSLALVFGTSLISIGFDSFFFTGRYVSLLTSVYFVLPFLTVLQTNLYLRKFGLMIG